MTPIAIPNMMSQFVMSAISVAKQIWVNKTIPRVAARSMKSLYFGLLYPSSPGKLFPK